MFKRDIERVLIYDLNIQLLRGNTRDKPVLNANFAFILHLGWLNLYSKYGLPYISLSIVILERSQVDVRRKIDQ